MLGVPLVRLLLAWVAGSNGGRISDPQLMPQPGQQTLEPAHIAAAFHAHQHWSGQRFVKPLRLSVRMRQPAFGHFSSFGIDHSNLLTARMEITPYNLHRQLLSFSELFGH